MTTTWVVTFGTQNIRRDVGEAEAWLRAGDSPEAALAAADVATGATTEGAARAATVATASGTAEATFSLEGSAPNPVRAGGRAAIRFTLAEVGPVRLTVYDGLGREVAVLAAGAFGAGTHAAAFDATGLAPGVYVARLTAGASVATRRLLVIP